jgi:hypothetical protein
MQRALDTLAQERLAKRRERLRAWIGGTLFRGADTKKSQT